MPVYGPGYIDNGYSILSALITTLSQLIENLLAGGTLADGVITDAKVAADAGIAQSKIAGLVDDLAGLTTDVVGLVAALASLEDIYLPIPAGGSDGQVLLKDSSAPLGVRWADVEPTPSVLVTSSGDTLITSSGDRLLISA